MGDESHRMDLRALVEQHHALLYRYAYRLTGSAADAEDLTQETYCTAQAKLNQLRRPESALAWLCCILRNHYLRGRRSRPVMPIVSLEMLPEELASSTLTLTEIDEERLRNALGELPEPYRTPIVLYYFESFSYREIAAQMKVPIGTVMSRLARGKAFLRGRLRPEDAGCSLASASRGTD